MTLLHVADRSVAHRQLGAPPRLHPPPTDPSGNVQAPIERLSRRAVLPLLALALAPACAPIVTHGPRVEPGTRFTVTAGPSYSACDTITCDLELVPQAALGIRGGRPATASSAGFSVGANASINIFSSDLDVYVQAPTAAAPLDAGGGVLLSAAHIMPYVQAGRMREDRSGWYTTQGFAWMMRRPTQYTLLPRVGDDYAPAEIRPRYWAPSVAYRGPGRRALHVYVGGAFGTADAYDYVDTPQGSRLQKVGTQPVRVLMAGVTLEGTYSDLFGWRLPLP
jgi:hypothetical protein